MGTAAFSWHGFDLTVNSIYRQTFVPLVTFCAAWQSRWRLSAQWAAEH